MIQVSVCYYIIYLGNTRCNAVFLCPDMDDTTRIDIRKLSDLELKEAFDHWALPAFRVRQIKQWLWQKGVHSFEDMTNLSKELRSRLSSQFIINGIQEDIVQHSVDGTIKFRFKLHDDNKIESVLIPVRIDNRYTVCVSTQVGCSLTCSFCATGKMKRMRNLEAPEIYDQVFAVNQRCLEEYGHPITNIVFMGMGEPLLNYGELMKSIEVMTSPEGLGFSARRITVSTAGIAKMIVKMADDNAKVRLALSLHAADDAKRNQIMPINETNNLKILMEAMKYYFNTTGNKISYEYIAFKSFNDSLDDAAKLVKLCSSFPVLVNIIEYNPVEGVSFEKSDEDSLDRFASYLRDHGVMVTVRKSRGKDIDAACGQLANKE